MPENAAELKKINFKDLNKDIINVLFQLCMEAKKHAELIKSVGSVANLPPLDKVAYAREELLTSEKTALCLRLHYVNILARENGLEIPFPDIENGGSEKMTDKDYMREAEMLDKFITELEAAGAVPLPEKEIKKKKSDGEKISENPDADIMIKVMLLSPAEKEKN